MDGDCLEDIPGQLEHVSAHTTDLVVSIGGNDLMKLRHLLEETARGATLEGLLASPLAEFEIAYGWMLDAVLEKGPAVIAFSIYTALPFKEPELRHHAPSAIAAYCRNPISLRASLKSIFAWTPCFSRRCNKWDPDINVSGLSEANL